MRPLAPPSYEIACRAPKRRPPRSAAFVHRARFLWARPLLPTPHRRVHYRLSVRAGKTVPLAMATIAVSFSRIGAPITTHAAVPLLQLAGQTLPPPINTPSASYHAGLCFHRACALSPARFGRGFEVNMQALEEALSSDRPSESELLSLVHSRLLCTRRELKGLKPGEMKYPFRCVCSWYCTVVTKRQLFTFKLSIYGYPGVW